MTVLLIWLNGREERCHSSIANVRDGVLILEVNRGEYRHIPLAQLREWRTNQ
jgi:hypothetical protein